jgi:hypothetical protein
VAAFDKLICLKELKMKLNSILVTIVVSSVTGKQAKMVCIAPLTPIPGLSPPGLSVQTGNLLAGDMIKRSVGDYEHVI